MRVCVCMCVCAQIHADVAGVPFIVTAQPEAPMLGCAMLVRYSTNTHTHTHTHKSAPSAKGMHTSSVSHWLAYTSSTMALYMCVCVCACMCLRQAAVAAGLHPDIRAASKAMVRVTDTIRPRPDIHTQYAEHYTRYCQLYPALAPLQYGRGDAALGGGTGHTANGHDAMQGQIGEPHPPPQHHAQSGECDGL